MSYASHALLKRTHRDELVFVRDSEGLKTYGRDAGIVIDILGLEVPDGTDDHPALEVVLSDDHLDALIEAGYTLLIGEWRKKESEQ